MPGATSPPKSDEPSGQIPKPERGLGWREVNWADHQRWVEVGGSPVNVIEIGSGPAVIFVHGLGGSWPNWLEQLPSLASSHRAIAMDLPGFGHSPMPSGQISIERYAETVAGVMEALGVDSSPVVGNSMGGQIALRLALDRPDLVERLVLVSPAGISTRAVAKRLGLIRRARPLIALSGRLVARNAQPVARRPWLRGAALSVVAAKPRRLPPDLAMEQLRGMGKPGFLPAVEAIAAGSMTFDEEITKIACPTLIVWGQNDPLITVRDADVFARQIPQARKIVWQGTGHVAMFERPAEFNALLEGFLSG